MATEETIERATYSKALADLRQIEKRLGKYEYKDEKVRRAIDYTNGAILLLVDLSKEPTP